MANYPKKEVQFRFLITWKSAKTRKMQLYKLNNEKVFKT